MILIVEDEEPIRSLINRHLTRGGYSCIEASGADEALEQLASKPVDLVILNIIMPGRSGLDLLPQIRSEFPNTPVIMVTGMYDPATIIRCMRSGACDYIVKPFKGEELLLSVRNALIQKRSSAN